MSREVKFRAWDGELKEMLTVYVIDQTQHSLSTPNEPGVYYEHTCRGFWGANNQVTFRYDQVEWMQYTGKQDASFDPKDIYEGDLFGTEDEVFGEVYFDIDFAGFCVRYPSGGWTTLGEHLVGKGNHREVIGNIYENPELLAPPTNQKP